MLLSSLLLLASSNLYAEEPITVRFTTYSSETSPVTACNEKVLLKKLEEESKGRLKLEVHYAGSPLSVHARQYEQIARGVTDVSITYSAFHPGQTAPIDITAFPFLIKQDKAFLKAFNEMIPEFEKHLHPNVKLLSLNLAGNALYGIRENTPIKDFTELRPYKILGPSILQPYSKAIGLNQAVVPFSQWYESLSKGVYDGWGGATSQTLSWKLHEVSNSYYYIPNFQRAAGIMMINRSFYDKLPEDLQAAFHRVFNTAQAEATTQCVLSVDAMAKGLVSKKGSAWNEATPEQIETMAKLTSQPGEVFIENLGKQFKFPAKALFDQLVSLQDKYLAE